MEVEIIEDVNNPEVAVVVPGELTCSDDVITLDGASSSQGPEFSYEWNILGSSGALLDHKIISMLT